MATAPLTRLTRWLEPKLLRAMQDHGGALGIALGVMMAFGDKSYGPTVNLAILAGAFAAWKLARTERGSDLIGKGAFALLEGIIRFVRWKRLRKGTAALIARFPIVESGGETHRIAFATLKDADGAILYQIRVNASPAHEHGRDVLNAYVGITDMRDPARSSTQRKAIPIVDGFLVFTISELDPGAPAIGDQTITVDMASGQTEAPEWSYSRPKSERSRSGSKPEAPLRADAAVTAAISNISDKAVRAKAAKIAKAVERARGEKLAGLRRDAGRLLHPDVCKVPGAPEALAAINARIDAARAA